MNQLFMKKIKAPHSEEYDAFILPQHINLGNIPPRISCDNLIPIY